MNKTTEKWFELPYGPITEEEKQLQDFQNWPFSIEKKTFGWSDVAIDIRDGGRTFVASGADAGMEVVFYPPSQEFVEV
jgi:hypothetical protein|tara:strand:- start:35 stop:268 length:234 start_codon:yes stop_codon:yes gene_type:complete